MKFIVKNILLILLFIQVLYILNRLSKDYSDDIYNEYFNDFNDITSSKSTLSDLIRVETERCSAVTVCGNINGKQISCEPSNCDEKCICKMCKPKSV